MDGKSQIAEHMPARFPYSWELDGDSVSLGQVAEVFKIIRQEGFLIHMVPNAVSATFCADGLAALGARPLMAVEPEEMGEIVAQADGCVVNLGQLSQKKLAAARLALQFAADGNKPLVLDPVGCGASSFRLGAVQELLSFPWKGIVKGNRSEIYSIQQKALTREGVDSLEHRRLTGKVKAGCTYLVTGEPDCILWEGGRLEISHKDAFCHSTESSGGLGTGNVEPKGIPCQSAKSSSGVGVQRDMGPKGPFRQNVVGSGCLAGAVAGACCSAASAMGADSRLAAISASLGMAFALEQASAAKGYGAAKSTILDSLCLLREDCFWEWLSGRARKPSTSE